MRKKRQFDVSGGNMNMDGVPKSSDQNSIITLDYLFMEKVFDILFRVLDGFFRLEDEAWRNCFL